MSFVGLVVKNLLRQRVRAGLTLLGISIGITTVVALGAITNGLKGAAGEVLQIGGADFIVAQKGTSDLSFSTVSEEDWQAVSRVDGVQWATGVLFHITKMPNNPYFVLLGERPEDLADNPPALKEGRVVAPGAADEVMLGDGSAGDLDAGVGEVVTISDRQLTVAGIYHTGRLWEDNGGYAPLATVQELAAKPSVVTVVYVKAEPDVARETLTTRIRDQFPNLTTVSSVEEYGQVDQGIELIDAANLAISFLAIAIGAVGVMNTMVMSVFERTREIGILRAVGWSGRRVIRMIVIESLMLCAVAAVLGSLAGVAATRLVLLVPAISSLLEPSFTPAIFVRALVVAIGVALVGAAYPAYRAVRLTPMEALRYE
ncbi:MAG TPA: FtsX-like permease family protein [Tepidiformaceae bacterium]|nr:FtsX-like permease family protein [Tepidiformaceae bacterium]